MDELELKNAVRKLVDHCDNSDCGCCQFMTKDGCALRGTSPLDWEIYDWFDPYAEN